ncbi:MAG: L,D-transpeptidase family protein [Candidatus Kapabacteria bacterium]|nr:L,D-transpeptidase family protein [Candidatus Kapabacteria bacterium]
MQLKTRSKTRNRTILFSMAASLFLASCGKEASTEDVAEKHRIDSVRAIEEQRDRRADSLNSRFPKITYHRLPVDSKEVLDSIRRTFAKSKDTWTNYRALTLLNRKDIQYVRIGDTLVLPDTIIEDLRAYSVFPQYWPEGDTVKKAVFISNTWQSYACYQNGELVRFAACNSGEERKPTLPGRYAVNWRDRKRISSLDSTWILPFTVNFHLQAGSAFHQFDMPGRPVSHSCVRQFLSDAEWLYRWVRTARVDTVQHRFIPWSGTPVVILDIFDFRRRRGGPWLELTSNSDVRVEMPKDLYAIEEALIPISQIPKEVRGSLRDKKRYVTADSVLRERGIIREGVHLRESINFNKLRQEKKKRKLEAKKKAESQQPTSSSATN